MTLDRLFFLLCWIWPLSELWIGLRHRPDRRNEVRDHGTLRLLLVVIYTSVALAVWLAFSRHARFPESWRIPLLWAGCAMMAVGMALRVWSVRTLAQFFTIQVAIREGHRLIRRGPYRVLRHPSYTGALLTFYGFGLALGDALALIAVTVPVTVAFLRRINIEERVLAEAFPDEYPAYSRQTRRLIPYLW